MFVRQSFARLYSSFGKQRKLFLLVFLWTCLCLVIFKLTLFTQSQKQREQEAAALPPSGGNKLYLRSLPTASSSAGAAPPSSLAPALYLAPDSALADNVSTNALYYSLSSISGPAQAAPSHSSSAEPSKSSLKPASQPGTAQALAGKHVDSDSSSEISDVSSNHPATVLKQSSAPPTANTVKHKQLSNNHNTNSNNEFVAGSQCNYDYPNLFDLQFNNIHWQRMTNKASSSDQQQFQKKQHSTTTTTATTTANSSASEQKPANFYLYNAYYDDRWRGGLPSVRVLAMIDRIQPPPTNCLFWSGKLREPDKSVGSAAQQQRRLVPLVTRATFVYAWYPKWGNYKDGLLQPWIVTCPMPRSHVGLVPDSVSLVGVPSELPPAKSAESLFDYLGATDDAIARMAEAQGASVDPSRAKRDASLPSGESSQQPASIAMPASFSSSSPSIAAGSSQAAPIGQSQGSGAGASTGSRGSSAAAANGQQRNSEAAAVTKSMKMVEYDCKQVLPITNNLPVYNQRPLVKKKFAVCVKGLDFPHEDVSVRLVEWIELLNLLGAGKIFLYNLDVHENISKVLNYYQKRGIVELSPLTLPGDQPNLPEYQHLYLKNKLTAKRQNELIPYNDCLYRNLNSYQYLALLDIDEIIMPLKHQNWFDLMQEVETMSLSEQNYSRASYNVRNVYFFDDLAGPLGTTSSSSSEAPGSSSADGDSMDQVVVDGDDSDQQQAENRGDSLERGIPYYLHMMQHVYRSKNYTKPGQYVKCFHNTERVVSLHNHFPMNCFGQCTTYSVPVHLAHLQHYRKDCVGPLRQSCKNDFRVFTQRDTTIWKYKQQMIRRTTRVLNRLGLLSPPTSSSSSPSANESKIKNHRQQ